jgi:type I restriction enzyme S subunit
MSYKSAPWKTVPLPEVLDFREGPGILARDFRTDGIPLLRLAGLKRGASLLDGCDYLDPDMVDARWAKFRVAPGDVLLSTSASLGEVAVVDEEAAGAIPYTGIIRFRPLGERVISEFIEFALRAPSFRLQIEAMGVGSVMRHFGPMHLRQMTVELPPVQEQMAVSSALKVLDDKIAINDRIVATANSLLQAYFSVTVRNAERVVRLGELVELKYGKALKEEGRAPGQIPVFGGNGISGWHDAPLNNGPGIIVGRKGANAGSVSWSQGPFWPIDTAFYVDSAPGNIPLEFLLFLLEDAGLRNIVGDSAIPGLNREMALSLTVRLPAEDRIKLFTETAKPLLAMNAQITEESRILVQLRDTLLPSLMSGEIRVRDAEKVVEDVM